MNYKLFKKELIIGLIIMFIGTSFLPIISGDSYKRNTELIDSNNFELNSKSNDNIPLDENLIGYWSFNEGSGTTLKDSSGNGNDGIVHGNPAWTTGISGNALSFDGIDDYVDIPDVSDFVFANEDFSFSAWVQIYDNANVYRHVIYMGDAKGDPYNPRPFIYLGKIRSGIKDGRLAIVIAPPPGTIYGSSILTGDLLPKYQWLYLTGVVDYPNTLKFYINGELQETSNLIDFNMADDQLLKLHFGRSVFIDPEIGGWFLGLIDEIRIYKKALNENEIQSLYENPGQTPNVPIISGPTKFLPNIYKKFTVTSTDPNGYQIYYYIDWGDGSIIDWQGPYASGAPYKASHKWVDKATFTIKCKAKNIYGAESGIGTLDISTPRSNIINTPFLRFLENHPNLFPLLQIFLKNLL